MTNKSKKLRNTKMSKKSRKTGGNEGLYSWVSNKAKDTYTKAKDTKDNIGYKVLTAYDKGKDLLRSTTLTKIAKSDLVKEITSRLKSAYSKSSASITNDNGYDTIVTQDFPQNWKDKQEKIAAASGEVKKEYKTLVIENQKPKQIHGFIPGTTTEGGKFYAIDADDYLSSKFPEEKVIGPIILKYINDEGIKKINEDNEKKIVGKVLHELFIDEENTGTIKNSFTPTYDCVPGLSNCGEGVKTELSIKLSENEKNLILERYATSESADEERAVITGGRKSSKTRRKSKKMLKKGGGIPGVPNFGLKKLFAKEKEQEETSEQSIKDFDSLQNDLDKVEVTGEPTEEQRQKLFDIKIKLLKLIEQGDDNAKIWDEKCKPCDKYFKNMELLRHTVEVIISKLNIKFGEEERLDEDKIFDQTVKFDFKKAIQETETAKLKPKANNTTEEPHTTSTGGKSNKKRSTKRSRK